MLIIGDIGVDLVVGPVDAWPAVGTEMLVDRAEFRIGFSAANAALAARHLGHDCVLVGAVGDDDAGRGVVDQLHGIDARLFTMSKRSTTLTIAVARSDGERSFLTTRGHLEDMRWADVTARLDRAGPGDIALLTGVFLMPAMRAAYGDALTDLRALGYRIAIDTGWPTEGWTPDVLDEVARWLPLCDILLLNEIEMLGLGGGDDVDRALARVVAMMAPDAIAVVKLGTRGAAAVRGTTFARAVAPRVSVFDSVGAGDSFNAAFLAAVQNGHPLDAALAAACAGASTIIAHFPRSSIAPGALAGVVACRTAAA